MTIRYTPAARDDLRAVKAWIIGEFGDAVVADKAVVDIIKGIGVLKRNPQLARPLQDKVHRKTDYKYILCGKRSIAILRIEAATASVIRILDTRTDYITTIFGD